jgi:S1-C subfamily serine protease
MKRFLVFLISCLMCFSFLQSSNIPVVTTEKESNKYEEQYKPVGKDISVVDTVENSWADVCQRSKNAIVQIFSYVNEYDFLEPYKTPKRGSGSGTGFFISDNGEILTNFHVVSQAIAIYIQIPSLGKERFEVIYVGASPQKDVAKLKLPEYELKKLKELLGEKPISYLTLSDSDFLKIGEEIMVIGYPLGQENIKASKGDVSGTEASHIQTTASINPGNSGGPVLNKKGKVIGIVVSKLIGTGIEGIAYIIPSNNVNLIFDKLDENKILIDPYWGVEFTPTTEEMLKFLGNPHDGGIYVTKVSLGSLGSKSDIKNGDVIYEINGNKIDRYGCLNVSWSSEKIDITDFLLRCKIGSEVKITIYRNGKRHEKIIKVENETPFNIQYYYPWISEPLDYEVFAGLIIMPLTMDHINFFENIEKRYNVNMFAIKKYGREKRRFEPRIIITKILPSSPAHEARFLQDGDFVVSRVNGDTVKTISDFRKAVLKSKGNEYVTVEMEEGSFLVLSIIEILEKEDLLSKLYFYKKSDLLDELASAYQN